MVLVSKFSTLAPDGGTLALVQRSVSFVPQILLAPVFFLCLCLFVFVSLFWPI